VNPAGDLLNVIDVEATCWAGEPPPGQVSEIIEIGLAVVDGPGLPYPFGPVHVNAKAVFSAAAGMRRRPGMAAALQIAGLRLEGRHHSGADDAWNIAALITDLIRRGKWPGP
jgi:inhibitor of KinA sporulation pathway (predicted exonuclease)